MKDTPTRVFGLMCVLVGVWTTVYWLYEPGEPPVTFDQVPVNVADPLDNPVAPAVAPSGGPMAELSPPIVPPPERRTAPRPPADAPRPAPQEQPRTRVVPPEYWEYTVQRGDSMESIARRLFGEGRLWVKIAEANPLLDARKLVPGRTKLRIPKDLTNIQGKEVPVPQDQSEGTPRTPDPEPVTPARAPEPAQQVYVVKSGDTLSGIAKALYGKSALWRKIYDANTDVIEDPDNVKPGTTIRIPPQD